MPTVRRIFVPIPMAIAFALSPQGCATGVLDDAQKTQSALRHAADEFPEAVIIDMVDNNDKGAKCTGVLLKPYVVLTAGHCVINAKQWRVTAPYAGDPTTGGITSTTDSAEAFDYVEREKDLVNPDAHDVGLIFLKDPIVLKEDQWPELQANQMANGQSIFTIGRRPSLDQGVSETVYVSDDFRAYDAAPNFRFDYQSEKNIERGDSGGPCFAAGSHTIVAVNSGLNNTSGISQYARVDLVRRWILDAEALHKSECATDIECNHGQPHQARVCAKLKCVDGCHTDDDCPIASSMCVKSAHSDGSCR